MKIKFLGLLLLLAGSICVAGAQTITLISPTNQSTVNASSMFFTWTPVSYPGSTVEYEYRIAEILSHQNELTVLANSSTFVQNFSTTSCYSPILIEEGKSYVWSVRAFRRVMNYELEVPQLEVQYISTIAVGVFHRGLDDIEEEEEYAFIKLNKEHPVNYEYFIPDIQDTIYVKYPERYASDSVFIQLWTYNVTDSIEYDNDTILNLTELSEPAVHLLNRGYGFYAKTGVNYLKIPKAHFVGAVNSGSIYFLELRNMTGELYKAKIDFE